VGANRERSYAGIIKEATVGVAISSNNSQPFTAKLDQLKLSQQ
jgi:hypothetical protein